MSRKLFPDCYTGAEPRHIIRYTTVQSGKSHPVHTR